MSDHKKKTQADIINKFHHLNKRLKAFEMHIKPWGYLAVALDSDPYGHAGYALNNVSDIDVIEGFIDGLEYMAAYQSESEAQS
jgi:hypothetical protein